MSMKYNLNFHISSITLTFAPISLCAPIHHPQILNPHALTHLLLVRRLSVTHVCACVCISVRHFVAQTRSEGCTAGWHAIFLMKYATLRHSTCRNI